MPAPRSLDGGARRWSGDMAGRGSRHHRALSGKRWELVRLRVFARDGWRCRNCGRAGRLECDHVVPLRDGGDPWDKSNLQTLCRPCHIEKSARDGRGTGRRVIAQICEIVTN